MSVANFELELSREYVLEKVLISTLTLIAVFPGSFLFLHGHRIQVFASTVRDVRGAYLFSKRFRILAW